MGKVFSYLFQSDIISKGGRCPIIVLHLKICEVRCWPIISYNGRGYSLMQGAIWERLCWYPLAHRLHVMPTTPSLHGHCPDAWLQVFPEAPIGWQSQAGTRKIARVYIAHIFHGMLCRRPKIRFLFAAAKKFISDGTVTSENALERILNILWIKN